jgi:choline dehydrogenase
MVGVHANAPDGIRYGVMNGESSSDSAIAQWRADRTGPATYFTGNGVGLISIDDDHNHDPDFEILFEVVGDAHHSGYGIDIVLLQPQSRGNVLLKSAEPFDKPVINPNYLSAPDDIKNLIRGVRKVLKIFGADILKPITGTVNLTSDSTDEDIQKLIRQTAGTVFHPIGTCMIGDVVDEDLKVRGVSGLRIADASILPRLNRGHTMAPTVYIGEMAAEKILL